MPTRTVHPVEDNELLGRVAVGWYPLDPLPGNPTSIQIGSREYGSRDVVCSFREHRYEITVETGSKVGLGSAGRFPIVAKFQDGWVLRTENGFVTRSATKFSRDGVQSETVYSGFDWVLSKAAPSFWVGELDFLYRQQLKDNLHIDVQQDGRAVKKSIAFAFRASDRWIFLVPYEEGCRVVVALDQAGDNAPIGFHEHVALQYVLGQRLEFQRWVGLSSALETVAVDGASRKGRGDSRSFASESRNSGLNSYWLFRAITEHLRSRSIGRAVSYWLESLAGPLDGRLLDAQIAVEILAKDFVPHHVPDEQTRQNWRRWVADHEQAIRDSFPVDGGGIVRKLATVIEPDATEALSAAIGVLDSDLGSEARQLFAMGRDWVHEPPWLGNGGEWLYRVARLRTIADALLLAIVRDWKAPDSFDANCSWISNSTITAAPGGFWPVFRRAILPAPLSQIEQFLRFVDGRSDGLLFGFVRSLPVLESGEESGEATIALRSDSGLAIVLFTATVSSDGAIRISDWDSDVPPLRSETELSRFLVEVSGSPPLHRRIENLIRLARRPEK